MGSGLILLVIVGAWLAVLVPMALRSYESSSTRSVERFGDAMRVLSRRSGPADGKEPLRAPERGVASPWPTRVTTPVTVPTAPVTVRTTPVPAAPAEEPAAPVEPLLHRFRDDPPRPPLTLVERRRRVLLSLLGAAAVLLLGGLLSAWLLLPGVVLVGVAVAYVVHLRRLAVAKAERGVREAGRAPAAQPARPAVRVSPAPRTAPVPAAEPDVVLPAASGGDWSPVPVPPPVYVGKPVAPPRTARTLDLTGAGRWDDEAATTDEDRELDDILDGRRAVNGW